ncbi:Fluoren-9-ol dehydrogenase [Lasiodiplodia theobromae]|uniref:Fluoren-9-ol dehydrogenase n=1 Tax=Lasiodiplodia theobromae TaxID=45133 RepID=A0A5N5D6D2_9PEZI|nr:Fluoren-9-ol dehydrogenase [Lasiodiplodia theobromae]
MPSYLVTGAGRGLGYGFITSLASNPDNTVLGLVRNKKATQDRLAADGITNVHLIEADITDEPALKRAADEAKAILGHHGLDILINNAAYVSETTALKSLKDLQVEHDLDSVVRDTQKSFDINVFGVVKTVFAFLPLVQQSTLKKIVVISSGMSDVDFVNTTKIDNAAPYAASKAATNIMFAKLAAAYEEQGILFMSLCPGLVDTTEGRTVTLPSEDAERQQRIGAKMEKYAPGFAAADPLSAAERCLAAIERSTLSGGYSGSFLSHNGTRKWM